jgi:hypothetical protein
MDPYEECTWISKGRNCSSVVVYELIANNITDEVIFEFT